jgi:uncharacterized membrane protein
MKAYSVHMTKEEKKQSAVLFLIVGIGLVILASFVLDIKALNVALFLGGIISIIYSIVVAIKNARQNS